MSEISMPKKSNTKKYIHFGVVLAFMFLFRFVRKLSCRDVFPRSE